MALSLSDNPKADKPAEDKPAKAEEKKEEKVKKQDTGDPRLNNQTNTYGETSDHSEAEERDRKLRKISDQSADVLAAAAGSSDAGVQNLLGQRAVAEQNLDEDELKRIDKELGEAVK